MKVEIKTAPLRKVIGKRIKYKLNGSSIWTNEIINEIVNKNIIFENDSRHFSQISEIQLIENE